MGPSSRRFSIRWSVDFWTNNGQRHDRPTVSPPSTWTNTLGTKCAGQALHSGLITQRSRVQIPSPRQSRRESQGVRRVRTPLRSRKCERTQTPATWGRRGGELVLDHDPDLRRWDKKIIGQTHRLWFRSRDRATSRDRAFESDHRGGGPRLFGLGSGAEEVAHHPYEPPRGDIFRRRGCGGSRGCSNHVSIDSSRGRFA
jgi:hypothetical protein